MFGGGGGRHSGTARGGGRQSGEDAGSSAEGVFHAGASGWAGAMIVGAGLLVLTASSTSVVPSCVQKLSQSSSNVRLHVGQRFMSSADHCRTIGSGFP